MMDSDYSLIDIIPDSLNRIMRMPTGNRRSGEFILIPEDALSESQLTGKSVDCPEQH